MSAVRHITEKMLDRAVELRKEGLQWKVVATRLQVDPSTLKAAVVKKRPGVVQPKKHGKAP